MGLALEIKYALSSSRGIIIADSLPCLILEGFTGMAVTSGLTLIREWMGGSNRDPLSKNHPEAPLAGAIYQTSHHTSHKP